MNYIDVAICLKQYRDPKKAEILQGFFKTGKGEYGYGDIFLGITVPKTRIIAKKFIDLELDEVRKLMRSKFHEERLCALLILVLKYNKAEESDKKTIYNFYVKNVKYINNWDLVDLSAPKIMGNYLLNHSKDILYKFVYSENLWQRRISIISTFFFIYNKEYFHTLKIAKILLGDKHDIIHKAVGWALREVGKKSKQEEIIFLDKYYKIMPRTMLRYAIEKFPELERKKYLRKSPKILS